MDCVKTAVRPALSPEYQIDWAGVEKAKTVAEAATLAKAEHARFVGSVHSREGAVSGYILAVEGDLFACSNDAAWLREWSSKTH